MSTDSVQRQVRICGTGYFLGEKKETREESLIAHGLDPDNLPADLRGVVPEMPAVRHRALDPEACTSTLMTAAAKAALKNAGVRADEVGLLICTTSAPDFVSPATSARVQAEIEAVNAGFFDLSSGCAGFSYALAMASDHLKCNPNLRYVLVVGGNLYSKILHPGDIVDQLLFSDGAGALLLTAEETSSERGFQRSAYLGKGQLWSRGGLYAGGTWKAFTSATLAEGYGWFRLSRPYDKGINIASWPIVIKEVLWRTGWSASDLNRLFLTQSSPKSLNYICDVFGWDRSLSHDTVNKFGYLAGGCIPAAIHDAIELGRVKTGDKVLILTSGIGYSCSAVTLVW